MRAALADIRALTAAGRKAFETDRSAQQAVAYNLAVLGEAARALSPELRERHPQVPWRDVIAQRYVVVHEYHRLDLESLGPPRRSMFPSSTISSLTSSEQSEIPLRPTSGRKPSVADASTSTSTSTIL